MNINFNIDYNTNTQELKIDGVSKENIMREKQKSMLQIIYFLKLDV